MKFSKLSLSLLLSFTLSLQSFAFYADVPETHRYHDQIESLYDQKLLPETLNFEPDTTLTKGDFYELLLTFGQAKLSPASEQNFKDVPITHPQAAYIQTAIDLNLLSPIKNQDLGVDFPIKKHLALEKMFQSLSIGQKLFFDESKFPFKDITPKSYTAKTAFRAAELAIVDEHAPQNFAPFANITKAEGAYYLYQIQNYSAAKKDQPITIKTTNKKEESDHPIFDNVWDTIDNDYLNKKTLDKKALEYSAIQGLMTVVNDPYTIFEEPDAAAGFLQNFGNELEGIGITIEKIASDIVIVSPIKNSPAEKAGLKANDIIIKVNDEDVKDLSLGAVSKKIKGPAGTKVKITITRAGSEMTFEIERNFIIIETVTSRMVGGSALLEIKNFSRGTYKEFAAHLEKIAKEKPKSYIIDLRNNPGGYLDIAIDLIGLFSKEQIIAVKLKDGDGKTQTFTTTGDGRLAGAKVYVLVNAGSASASEILAGALQDYEFAKIIGQKTFGKGTAQSLTNYTDGSLLRLTSAEWLTPNDRSIQAEGITPDIITKEGKELEEATK